MTDDVLIYLMEHTEAEQQQVQQNDEIEAIAEHISADPDLVRHHLTAQVLADVRMIYLHQFLSSFLIQEISDLEDYEAQTYNEILCAVLMARLSVPNHKKH